MEDMRAKLMGTKPRVLLREDAVPSVFSHIVQKRPKHRESTET